MGRLGGSGTWGTTVESLGVRGWGGGVGVEPVDHLDTRGKLRTKSGGVERTGGDGRSDGRGRYGTGGDGMGR